MARSHRLRRRGTGRHYLRWLRRRILTPGRQPRAAGPSQGLPPQLAGAQEHLREDGMTGPGAAGRRSVAWRLAAISLAGAAVTGALYAAGRLHTPNYTFSLFGQTGLAAITLKSLLASVVLGLAALQVLLAPWIYRKLPLAGSPPRPVRPAHHRGRPPGGRGPHLAAAGHDLAAPPAPGSVTAIAVDVGAAVVVIGYLSGRAEPPEAGPAKAPATMIHLTVNPPG